MRRTVSEGTNREAESHMEEYRVRRPSDVSSKMPSVMSSEVVLLRFMSVGKLVVYHIEDIRRVEPRTFLPRANTLDAYQ